MSRPPPKQQSTRAGLSRPARGRAGAPAPTAGAVAITLTAATGRPHVPFLRRMLARAVPMVPRAPGEISVALVGDRKMSDLHQQFMDIDGPTDVLTFELEHDARGRVTSGEVVVCVPEARRRAQELGHRLEHELLLYALHGVLHLSGHDDRTAPAYRRMHAAEDRILTRLGIGAVFASQHQPKA